MQYNKNVLIRKGGSIITKKTFGEYVSVKNGYAFKRKNFVEKGIPIIRISDLTTNNMNLKECAKYPYHTLTHLKYCFGFVNFQSYIKLFTIKLMLFSSLYVKIHKVLFLPQ